MKQTPRVDGGHFCFNAIVSSEVASTGCAVLADRRYNGDGERRAIVMQVNRPSRPSVVLAIRPHWDSLVPDQPAGWPDHKTPELSGLSWYVRLD
jgi:hypothetical protein